MHQPPPNHMHQQNPNIRMHQQPTVMPDSLGGLLSARPPAAARGGLKRPPLPLPPVRALPLRRAGRMVRSVRSGASVHSARSY